MKKSSKSSNRNKRIKKRRNCSTTIKSSFLKSKKHKSQREKGKDKIQIFPEYYQIVFADIHVSFGDEIYNKYVLDSQSFRRKAVLNRKSIIIRGELSKQYEALKNILFLIEDEMREVIKNHSVFFWLHMYRRLAPCLSADLGANTDENVTVNVRQLAEQAIKKYGSLSNLTDFALSSEVDFDLILGGLCSQSYKKHFSKDAIYLYSNQLKNSTQWVLTDFSVNDLLNIYYIEGLSYQYWYISAKMRSLGKDVLLSISDQGDIFEKRTKEQDYLISNFDLRNEDDNVQLGIASNVGTYTFSNLNTKIRNHELIINAHINASLHTANELGLNNLPEEFSPNFIPWYIITTDFYKSHSYLSTRFIKTFGFGLLEIVQLAGLLSNLFMSDSAERPIINESLSLFYYSKFQRGYCTINYSISQIKKLILNSYLELRKAGSIRESELIIQIDDILNYVTLTEDKQKNIGVWSCGPQYVLVGLKEGFLCDSFSWHFLFRNMFYGLRNYDPRSIKGHEFEATFSKILKAKNFNVILESKAVRCGEVEREIDVAVRIHDCLYLFECKASERPLNFDIGDPKTIANRTRDFQGKLEQADSLREFILTHKTGNNYDFSWAQTINSSVVSPFTEWVWSKSPTLWTECENFPRIMSVNDAIKYLISEQSKVF